MPSPFPGMDPYLEAHWGDVHLTLITHAREALQRSLPRDLRARAGERVFVESDARRLHDVYPDVRVYEHVAEDHAHLGPASDNGGAVAVAAPLIVQVDDEPKTERFLEIREAGTGGRVITVIEFVSPSNNSVGKGRNLYLQKQDELHESGVNSVEIDLLRAGSYTLAVPEERLPPEYRTPYCICTWRAARPLQYEVYRAPLRERLPIVQIPLRESDDDVPLDLRALIDRTYDTGAYEDLDHARDPDPPLSADNAQWADDLLRKRGVRVT